MVVRLSIILLLVALSLLVHHQVVTALASSPSLGQAIQSVATLPQGLQVAQTFWLPTDPDLPPHYTQAIHHENRQRWASQLLETLFRLSSRMVVGVDHDQKRTTGKAFCFLQDAQFQRLVQAAAIPHATSTDRPHKEGVWLLTSLQSLHGLVGRAWACRSNHESTDSTNPLTPETAQAIQQIIERAYSLSRDYSLDQACQLRWSTEGLYARLGNLKPSSTDFAEQREALRHRLSRLPFEIVPLGLDWTRVNLPLDGFGNNHYDNVPDTTLQTQICRHLQHVIPFAQDSIITRRGVTVTERRSTAWLAAAGIGNLAYSGKLMTPCPIPPVVEQVMLLVEQRLDDLGASSQSLYRNDPVNVSNTFFDCALCNHYADAASACKFHTDPEHGSLWHRTTVVVAAGMDRKFAFKPIAGTWSRWDALEHSDSDKPGQTVAASIHLFAGDLVVMRDNCNDDFYHAVHAGENDQDRVSLVLKKALDRGGGRKGHGQPGQGRRARRSKRKVLRG